MTKVKPSTRKAKNSSSSTKSMDSLRRDMISSLWVKRRYDWQKQTVILKLMPDDFVPPTDDDESYVSINELTKEILDDVEKEDEKQKLFESADIILNGTEWLTSKCSETNSLILFDDDDGDVTVPGMHWGIATHDGKTYLKKLEEEKCCL